jgi:1-phosphofructokinase
MIVTLTMNPAIDRTVIIESVALGETNRIQEVKVDASGKGVNVSRALLQQGLPSLAMGFLGGTEGEYIATSLKSENLETKFTWIEQGSTRVNTKVYEQAAGRTTELNEPGPVVTSRDVERLYEALEEVLPQTEILICAGSLPRGMEGSFYYDLIQKCKKSGVQVFLDASGNALTKGVQAIPTFIKPNEDEAEMLLGKRVRSRTEIITAMHDLRELGIPYIVLSLGEAGAVFCAQGEPLLWAQAQAEQVLSTSGCGDSLLASFVSSLVKKRSWLETVRWSVATATATAEMTGTVFPDLEHIQRSLPRVRIEEL